MTTTVQLSLVNPPATDIHADARRHVWLAIETAAAMYDGHVSPNVVRAFLSRMPEWETVPPNLIGKVYADLIRQRVLVEVGTERTTGSTSGNNGRLAPTYRLVTG